MKVAVRYFTEFGSSVSTMEIHELASWINRYNFKISSIEEVEEPRVWPEYTEEIGDVVEQVFNEREITHEEIFNDDKKAKLKEFIDKFKDVELFKRSNDRAREILANIKWLPKVCNDCNTALESCTCIEDTLEIKEETKCYCGHTTICECGPNDIEDAK